MGQTLEEEELATHSATCQKTHKHPDHHEAESDGTKEKAEEAKEQEADDHNDQDGDDNDVVENQDKEVDGETPDEPDPKLVRMGLNTAIAIGLHNFPEGLATFVAALNDPRVGAILAFAIAIHNIPEGLCVALPVYYATGNRMKAFMWALLSGASEFVAALLGWAILANSFSDDLYAVLFGLVAGMMVTISTRELLPTAHVYDPEDTVVTYSYIGGMLLIALSLVLFLL
jgi:ZIP family zinc transporter